jgi:hypothetical protein
MLGLSSAEVRWEPERVLAGTLRDGGAEAEPVEIMHACGKESKKELWKNEP